MFTIWSCISALALLRHVDIVITICAKDFSSHLIKRKHSKTKQTMFRLFSHTAPTIRNSITPRFTYTLTKRTMASNTGTGKASNEQVNRSHLFDVSHVTAVVTGGGTGIGLMITQALVSNGAKVYITSRRDEVISETAKLYSEEKGDGQQGKIIPIQADVSDKEDVKRLADEIALKEPNGIQLLVNNAGIARDDSTKYSNAGEPDFSSAEALREHFWKSPPEAWADTFKTNTTAIYYTSFAFLPLLAKGTTKTAGYSSSIVNITSVSGFNKGNSRGQFAYATSKAAATHLTRMLAHTFSQTKVRVNAIAPGLFPSEVRCDS